MYLTQSWQLYLEAAMYGVGRCFDFWPVFRAEKSKTRRHLNEFWMMDAEIPFIQQDENMQIQEDLMKYIIAKVLEINAWSYITRQRSYSTTNHSHQTTTKNDACRIYCRSESKRIWRATRRRYRLRYWNAIYGNGWHSYLPHPLPDVNQSILHQRRSKHARLRVV